MNVEWVEVPGGTCVFGDKARQIKVSTLLWTRTPITHAQLRGERGGERALHPVTSLSHAQAAEIAETLGGRLPTSVEWEWMAGGSARRRWPWGDQEWTPERANLRGSGVDTTSPVDAHPAGATPEGLLDVAGNVWEWTARSTMGNGAVLRGGSYASPPLYARTTFLNAAPAELASPGIGLRVVRRP
ncbi:formylglycine-generating enzyme family protein [Streptoalloteichus hindustanus]|uniref:Iron(II)-dependent oxidoreductase n=1 Tax=Streptoalloteichus hindustanus TaxID=2017 RepID=A0A1M5D0P1_STRHI|nr:formylglycine-generating enzyme family protein [Streptoalloteichus hindustanus]SHF60593.1 iron(II)-dependent oxidoreductase [Streptoalloteichus hindustanus]